jgi:hypothetical protein
MPEAADHALGRGWRLNAEAVEDVEERDGRTSIRIKVDVEGAAVVAEVEPPTGTARNRAALHRPRRTDRAEARRSKWRMFADEPFLDGQDRASVDHREAFEGVCARREVVLSHARPGGNDDRETMPGVKTPRASGRRPDEGESQGCEAH